MFEKSRSAKFFRIKVFRGKKGSIGRLEFMTPKDLDEKHFCGLRNMTEVTREMKNKPHVEGPVAKKSKHNNNNNNNNNNNISLNLIGPNNTCWFGVFYGQILCHILWDDSNM